MSEGFCFSTMDCLTFWYKCEKIISLLISLLAKDEVFLVLLDTTSIFSLKETTFLFQASKLEGQIYFFG